MVGIKIVNDTITFFTFVLMTSTLDDFYFPEDVILILKIILPPETDLPETLLGGSA